ncbi:MAG: hypothetical protein ACE5IY_24425, partial [bacterium]
MAADWITQGLAQTGLVEMVPLPLAKTTSDGLENTNLIHELATKTGAGTVVTGAYYLQERKLQFHVQITDSLAQVLNKFRGQLVPYERYNLDWLQAHFRCDRIGELNAAREAARLVPGSAMYLAWGGNLIALNRPQEAIDA